MFYIILLYYYNIKILKKEKFYQNWRVPTEKVSLLYNNPLEHLCLLMCVGGLFL